MKSILKCYEFTARFKRTCNDAACFLSDESNYTHNLTGSVVEDTHEPSVPLHLGYWVKTIFLSRSFYENIFCSCMHVCVLGSLDDSGRSSFTTFI